MASGYYFRRIAEEPLLCRTSLGASAGLNVFSGLDCDARLHCSRIAAPLLLNSARAEWVGVVQRASAEVRKEEASEVSTRPAPGVWQLDVVNTDKIWLMFINEAGGVCNLRGLVSL